MGPRPWKPDVELNGALDRGDLRYAITLAAEVQEDQRRPIDLATALRFLLLVIAHRPQEFDAWACRWLARWLAEAPGATIEMAAEIAGALADLPAEPVASLDVIRSAC